MILHNISLLNMTLHKCYVKRILQVIQCQTQRNVGAIHNNNNDNNNNNNNNGYF